jgi:hypothetical protein
MHDRVGDRQRHTSGQRGVIDERAHIGVRGRNNAGAEKRRNSGSDFQR